MISDSKHIRATNIAAIAGVAVNAPWSLVNAFWGTPWVALENIVIAIGFLAAWIMNQAEKFDAAPTFMASISYAHIVFAVLVFGYESGAHNFFLLGLVFPFLIFRRSMLSRINAIVVVFGVSFLACVFFRDYLTGTELVGNIGLMATVNAVFLLLVLAATTAFFVIDMRQSEEALEAEYARSETLLYNLLPQDVAKQLKKNPLAKIADRQPNVAILFADIVGFTERASRSSPEELVDTLSQIFLSFDGLADKHGVEKIKTIGDAYMVAAGIPNPCPDPAKKLADLALDMLATMAERPDVSEIRIGIHLGPVIAGVIGHRKLFYDVWGDSVNTASRMESYGAAGKIQVTEAVRKALASEYQFEARGIIDVKGIGQIKTWWLVDRMKSP